MEAVLFTNFSNDVFTHEWDKQQYTFQPGQTIYLQDYLARHFAKHLIDREINRIDRNTSDILLREQMMKRCVAGTSTPTASAVQIETEILNKNEIGASEPEVDEEKKAWCDSCDAKGVRHNKDCPKSRESQSAKEETFEGLDETPRT